MTNALAPAEARGSLTIADRVVERTAVRAALEVDGVVESQSNLDALLRRSLPSVEVTVAGDRATVHLHIATQWPRSVGAIAGEVAERVTTQLQDIAAVTVDRIEVDVDEVVVATDRKERRVQ